MVELLNHSAWFGQHISNSFVRPESESCGECDAISQTYQLDFKLWASKTLLQGRSLTSPQIIKENGWTIWCYSRAQSFTSSRLHVLFRGSSLGELERIREMNPKRNGTDNDLFIALRTLETKKNLLLFFPYTFSFDVRIAESEAVDCISEGLNHDFEIAFSYREKYAAGYDTFLTCIYDEQFLMFRVDSGTLAYIDSVAVGLLPTYQRLQRTYVEWWK